MRPMKTLFHFFKSKDKLFLLLCFVCVTVQAWLELKIPEYISDLTYQIQTTSVTVKDLAGPGLSMLLIAAASLLIALLISYLISALSARVSTRMRSAVFSKIMSFSLKEMGQYRVSSLITRCTKDVESIYNFWCTGASFIMKAVVLSTLAIVKMANADIAWTTSTVIAVVLTVVMMVLVFSYATPKLTMVQQFTDEENRLVNEHLTGIRVVHAFNGRDYEKEKFSETNKALTRVNIQASRGMSLLMPGIIIVIYGMCVAIYWTGAGLISASPVEERALLYATMLAFASYATQCVQAFMLLIRGLMLVPGALASGKRIQEVLDTENSILDGEGVSKTEAQENILEFKHVDFRYPMAGADTLKDVSFCLKKGETAAFIGSTGSGKTTVLNLIPRLYEATGGEIYVNGVDIKKYTLKELRQMIGYVPQKASLFSRTIAENIDFGGDEGFARSLKEIREAAQVGQAHQFIMDKPEGYDTMIQPGGSNLSGGQRQRLSISRALCRKPALYLFDDSFSALDYATDRKLRSTLKTYAEGATMLIVGQRISTIRNVDKIFVLEKGQIVGCGTHDELMENCEVYREIARTQLMSAAEETTGGGL